MYILALASFLKPKEREITKRRTKTKNQFFLNLLSEDKKSPASSLVEFAPATLEALVDSRTMQFSMVFVFVFFALCMI